LAETDGFVVASNACIDGSLGFVYVILQAGSDSLWPHDYMTSSSGMSNGTYYSITAPIPQGDYWQLVTPTDSRFEPKVYWISFSN
jgi:hypothetical protein